LKKETENNLPIILRKLISTYLVHHGYSATAEAFAKSVGHVFEEELASIRNRQSKLGKERKLKITSFSFYLNRNTKSSVKWTSWRGNTINTRSISWYTREKSNTIICIKN
jgi:hypothetical protein